MSVDNSLGTIVIGVFLTIWLYGIVVNQVSIYFTLYKNDHPWMKLLVVWMLGLTTLVCIFYVAFIYRYTITYFGNYEAIARSHWFFHIGPVLSAAITATAQGYFVWRVQRLTRSTWLSLGIMMLLVAQLGGALATTIQSWQVIFFARFGEMKLPVSIWLVASCTADILITCILSWYLHTHRTGFVRTDDLISRLIRATVQTGMLTTLCVIIDLFTFFLVPTTLHLVFNLPLGQLYGISLMSTLNSRGDWSTSSSRSRSESTPGAMISMPTVTVDKHYSLAPSPMQRRADLARNEVEGDEFELEGRSLPQPKDSSSIDIEKGELPTGNPVDTRPTVQLALPTRD